MRIERRLSIATSPLDESAAHWRRWPAATAKSGRGLGIPSGGVATLLLTVKATVLESELEQQRLEEELAELAAHVNAATARWLELALEFRAQGGAAGDDFARWLAWRCGVSTREAREYVRVAEALRELPAIRAAFGRGELTLTKVRALTRAA